ncbi:MAG: isoprenylcysteine carboxylmethyltransferase family protein [Candidatus Omnitrophota bacterium]
MKRRIRIHGFLIFLSVATFILLSKFFYPHWHHEGPDEVFDAIGIAVVLFGFLFRIAARGYKAEMSPRGNVLITDGTYGLIRHPMYFGTLLIGLGITLVLFKLWVFFLFLIIFLLIYIPQVRKEENSLYRRFGDEYANYFASTPKYFPDIRRLLTANLKKYVFIKRFGLKKEIFSLIGVIAGIMAIEIWEDVQLFGYQELTKEFLELFVIVVCFSVTFLLLYEKEHISTTS